MTDRMDVIILKRRLGTASDWDGDPGELIQFHNFQPTDCSLLPCSLLMFREQTDTLEELDDNGDIIRTLPAVEFLPGFDDGDLQDHRRFAFV